MKNNKAAGICNIPAELQKYGGSSCTEWLTRIFQVAWRTGTIPEDWKKGIVLPFYRAREVGRNARITGESLSCLCLGKFSPMFY